VKNKVLIPLGVLAMVAIAGVVVVLNKTLSEPPGRKNDQLEARPTTAEVKKEPTPSPKMETWKDEAGFIFQYPSGLELTQNTDDKNSYANIEITAKQEKGKIQITAVDTRYNNVEAWVKYDESLKGGNIIETTMGGKAAKKILFGEEGKILVGSIDDQILFLIRGDQSKSEFWQGVFDQVHDSWTFFYPTQPASPTKKTGSSQPQATEDLGILEEIE